MGSKAGIKGISRSEEVVTTFKKESDGTYTKQTKFVSRDRITSAVKHLKRGVIEDGPFIRVSSSEDHDEKVEFEDYKGNMTFLYFKKTNLVEVEE
jgi:hypothetical protein